jgi:hypothetical protein
VKNASFFVVVLSAVFSGSAFAAACVPGDVIVGPATLSSGAVLTSTFSCTEGAYTFSNFVVTGDTVPTPITDFSVSTGPSTSASGLVLGIGYTDLDTNGDDFTLTFEITPGVAFSTLGAGPAVSVTEDICASMQTPAGVCSSGNLNLSTLSAANGGTSGSAVTIAGTDYVFKDIAGGSNVEESFTPEPVTSSLMGLGLMAIGLAGRKRLRKN